MCSAHDLVVVVNAFPVLARQETRYTCSVSAGSRATDHTTNGGGGEVIYYPHMSSFYTPPMDSITQEMTKTRHLCGVNDINSMFKIATAWSGDSKRNGARRRRLRQGQICAYSLQKINKQLLRLVLIHHPIPFP